jgi:hypothetical protein
MKCDSCGRDAPLRPADFGINIGLLLVNLNWAKRGRPCSGCVHQTFWGYTLVTLVFGWWELSSLVLTPVIVVLNTVSYCGTFFLRPYPTDPFQG